MAAPRSLKTVLILSLSALGVAALTPAAMAGCNAAGACSSWTSVGTAAPDVRTLPSTLTRSEVSNMRVNGLGANERLCPATCPVSVETPKNGQVLACYKVCTPVGSSASGSHSASAGNTTVYASSEQSQQSALYAPPEVEHHYEFTYHPVIYVHYPVPVPVYGLPEPCGNACAPMRSRYGH